MNEPYTHIPVLRDACIDALRVRPDGVYVDATLGGAGHALVIAGMLDGGRLIGIDRDEYALARAEERLSLYVRHVTLIHSDFRRIADCLREAGAEGADGILFDLGCSSFQLDDPERGFSYMHDAPLDMRMDRTRGETAYELINRADAAELRGILYDYGEERYAPRIAEAVVRERENHPIETTAELARIIADAMPAAARREKQHPAKRSFQALRIAVNDELTAIDEALRAAVDALNPGGRIAVISFHSLEDRIVKQVFAQAAQGCTCPPEFPVCVCGKKPRVRLIAKKPILPTEEECTENPRARSAKLRVAEKI
ncbi:MAG: 16S rRNA (cytosine(1402)-N(4))-methyltransferase RsmH [Clostridiaceae bacterium]|nr:16S rRNA (cytosine(1402)-N(4))-methyltransferase RsmH [Clostridiaceae bacterium]